MYLLDTNVVSELRRRKPHGAVLAWVAAQKPDDLNVCALTIGEIQSGAEIVREANPVKALELEAWLERVAGTYRVLDMDARVFREWARLMHRKSDTLTEDAMIAATVLVHHLTLATRNERHFRDFGIAMVNPFKSE